MDPFSPEGELFEIHNAYHQGQYSKVAEYDSSSFSADHQLQARVLILRAKIALGQAEDILTEVEDETDQPKLAAVAAFARYVNGDTTDALEAVEQLVAVSSEDAVVQVLGGTVLHGTGKSEEALALLSQHQGNPEAAALIVQIHLQQNRTDLALKEVSTARRWAQDSLLVNLAEAWVGLRQGGEKYQQAFYVFEELAQAPSTTSEKSLVGQAIAELHLGRLPEAEAALQQASEADPKDPFVLANSVVCSAIAGKDTLEPLSSLRSISPDHVLVKDLKDKSSRFDVAAANYTARVSA